MGKTRGVLAAVLVILSTALATPVPAAASMHTASTHAASAHAASALAAETVPVDDYRFSAGFSGVQGAGQWYYQQWNGSAYTDMTWDPAWNGWRGTCGYCIIRRDWVHPDNDDSVIAWKAPRAGRIAIRGVMDHGSYTTAGDGVRTFIRQRKGSVVSTLWPSSGVQEIRPGFTAPHTVMADVQADDIIYFHVNKGATTGYDTLSWDPRISYGYEPEFTQDKAELVMDPDDFARVGIDYALDASLSTVQNGSKVDFYHYNSGEIQKFQGTLDDPAQTSVYHADRYTNPQGLPGTWWIANIYQIDQNRLLAFCHIEHLTDAGGFWALGLAYSTDGGQHFQKVGFTVRHEVPDPDAVKNIGGVPYVVKDGYFYVYFNDGGTMAARAPVADVLAAAAAGTVSPWTKYAGGTWTQPGLGGHASTLLDNTTGFFYMTHGDAAYSTYLGKYLLTSYTHSAGRGIYLATSDDGVNFAAPTWIQTNHWEKDSLAPYETIVNADGSDNGVVGQSFYLYYGFRAKQTVANDTEIAQHFRWLYRQKISLNRPGFDRNTTDASTAFTERQGPHDWKYLEYAPSTGYRLMTWDLNQFRWNGTATNLMATSFTQHPDGGKDSVRAWTAPRAGTVQISAGMGGALRTGTGTGADGVGVRIMRGATQAWPASGYQLIAPGSAYAFAPMTVTVAQGEVLYFHVNQNVTTAYDTITWDPVITYTGTSRITYDGWDDYAGTQGSNGWQYAQSDGSAYTPMTWDAATTTWQGTQPYLLVRPTVQHPSGGLSSVRQWVAPKAGTVVLASRFGDISVASGPNADGVRVRVLHNGQLVWPASGYQLVPAGGAVAFPAIERVVAAGDTFSFEVQQNGTTSYDTTTWVPSLAYR